MNPSQAKVVSALKRADRRGLNRREIEASTKLRSGTVCARVYELLDMNVIERDGKRYDPITKVTVEVLRVRK
jgi:predicted transcriptional regulator